MCSNNHKDITYKLFLFIFFIAYSLNIFFHLAFDDFNNANYEDLGGIVPTFCLALLSSTFMISNAIVYQHAKYHHDHENNFLFRGNNNFLMRLKKIDPYLNNSLAKTHVLLAVAFIILMMLFDEKALKEYKKINEPATISGLIINKLTLLIFYIAINTADHKDNNHLIEIVP